VGSEEMDIGFKLGEAMSVGNVLLTKAMEVLDLWGSRQNINVTQCRGLRLIRSGGSV